MPMRNLIQSANVRNPYIQKPKYRLWLLAAVCGWLMAIGGWVIISWFLKTVWG